MPSEFNEDHDSDLDVEESEPDVEEPSLYKVILVNDDFTPMDFVVKVLERFFSKDRHDATQIMVEIHTKGKGICGIYTHEIAETKVDQVSRFSHEHQHPLLCTLEKA